VALVETDVSKELIATIIRVERFSELGTTLTVTSNRSTLLVTANVVLSLLILFNLMMEVMCSSETSVVTRATRRHISENGIDLSHRLENLKSYIALTGWTL
jgi:hypothetical protein